MTDPRLFDPPPAAVPVAAPTLSRDRRRTLAQRALLADGRHPRPAARSSTPGQR